jgi:hypothetical protein
MTYDLEVPGGTATSEPLPSIVFLFLPALLRSLQLRRLSSRPRGYP